jgi:hypothetical protein
MGGVSKLADAAGWGSPGWLGVAPPEYSSANVKRGQTIYVHQSPIDQLIRRCGQYDPVCDLGPVGNVRCHLQDFRGMNAVTPRLLSVVVVLSSVSRCRS